MKRRSLRSIAASKSTTGAPATWLRKPIAAYSGWCVMPERISRRELGDARLVVAEAGDDSQAGDDDASHQKSSVEVKRPTFRSVAT